jgi:hypothetical protein
MFMLDEPIEVETQLCFKQTLILNEERQIPNIPSICAVLINLFRYEYCTVGSKKRLFSCEDKITAKTQDYLIGDNVYDKFSLM